MAFHSTTDDEKRLLAAAETAMTVGSGNGSDIVRPRSHGLHSSRTRRAAKIRRACEFSLTLVAVAVCSVAALLLLSLAVGTLRSTGGCHKHKHAHHGVAGAAGAALHMKGSHGEHMAHAVPVAGADGAADAADAVAAGQPAEVPADAVVVIAVTGTDADEVVADAADADVSPSSFSRLLDAVSPDALHRLLHEHFPSMYKHGVYESERSALEAIHRENAALASSIVHLARRELGSNTTTTATTSATSKTTSATTTLPTTTAPTTKATTAVFTSTIDGTPTVVTRTSIVGVGASGTATGTTVPGTLQTNAAAGHRVHVAQAVAGVLVGALLI